MYKIILILASLLSSLVLNNAYAAGGGTGWGKITETYVNGGWTMVKVSGFSDNPDSCSSIDYYAINQVDVNYSALHATLLSAQMANKDVRFWVNGCGGQSNSRPHIVSVFVK